MSQLRYYNTAYSRKIPQIDDVCQPLLTPSESPFLDRVRGTIRLKHLSRRTEKSYLYYIWEKFT